MNPIEVTYQDGDRFLVRARQHRFLVDQPVEDGGEDHGPTPTELFVAGLAACIGFYAERFLRRHGLSPDGLAVGCDYTMSRERPARVTRITVVLQLGAPLSAHHREVLERVISRCTVHNSLMEPPEVTITVTQQAAVA